jgi:pimeloyl-ACP methyl ester carboxylesterase
MSARHTLITQDRIKLTYYTVSANKTGAFCATQPSYAAPKSRPVIMLLHGLGSNHTRWLELIDQTAISREWNIILPDLRGHGQSMARTRISTYLWTRDLAEILQQEKQQHVILVGHSLGAHIALAFLRLFPDKVSGLALIDPLLRSQFTPTMRWLWRLRILAYFFITLIRGAGRLGIHRRTIAQRDLREFDQRARQLIAQNRQEEMVKNYSSMWLDLQYNPAATYFKSGYEVLRPLPEFKDNTTPLLLLCSGKSAYKTGKADDTYFNSFRRRTIITVDCNHWPITEKPQDVYKSIEKWINREFNP